MPKEYSCFDDVAFVTGLKAQDEVLFIGENMSLPFLKRFVKSISYVRKVSELNKLIKTRRKFDRIFIGRENILSSELVLKASALNKDEPDGLLCFFSEDPTLQTAFVDILEQNFPQANIWPSKSNIGPVIMTDAVLPYELELGVNNG